jgi:adenylate kinase family enzyme
MRVVVVGCSGSGKSTFGRRLSEAAGIPRVELDAITWQPGWRPQHLEEPEVFFRRVSEAAAGDAWVMDGNYTKSRDAHWPRATAIVWLDPPKWRAMSQVFWRSLTRAISKKELWPGSGNKEEFRKWFSGDHPIPWAWKTHAMIRARYEEWFEGGTWQGVPVHRVKTRREAAELIRRLAAGRRPEPDRQGRSRLLI